MPAQSTWNDPNRLRIVYYNDIHEKYKAFPGIKTAFDTFSRQAEQRQTDVLRLCSGDWNVGPEPEQMKLNVAINNQLGLHAAAPGNHEADGGAKPLADSLAGANFPVLATNMYVPQTCSLYQRWLDKHLPIGPTIVTMPNGQRYGLIGLAVPDLWKFVTKNMPMEGAMTLNLQATIQRAQQDADWLRAQGVTRVIAMSHCGFPAEREIAQQTQGIDVIVGGHTHDQLPGIVSGKNWLQSASGEPVLIVQSGANGTLGVIDMHWDPYGRILPDSHTLYHARQFAPDPGIKQMIDNYFGPDTPLAWVAQSASDDNTRYGGENALANKAADAIYWALNQQDAAGVDLSILRATELRGDIEPGVLTDHDVNNLMPFPDTLATYALTGAQVRQTCDKTAQSMADKQTRPGIYHLAGVRYKVNLATQKAEEITVFNRQTRQWEPLRDDKTYRVGTGQYATQNTFENPMFKNVVALTQYPFRLCEAFKAYIKAQSHQPITFPLDGRLQVVPSVRAANNPFQQAI